MFPQDYVLLSGGVWLGSKEMAASPIDLWPVAMPVNVEG